MENTENVQNNVLNEYRKDKKPVSVYLVNGFQMKGIITGFDSYVVIVNSRGIKNMVFKHAISTISPIDIGGEIEG